MSTHDELDDTVAAEPAVDPIDETRPAPRRSGGRTLLAAVAFLLPILVAVVAVVVLAGRDDSGGGAGGPSGGGRTFEFSIPAGTAERMAVGYPVADVMPEQLDLLVGDTVVVENLDEAVHTFGPITVRPGETTRLTFDRPGYYFGICTVGTHDTVTFVVT
jgi:hypothetical protein